MSRKASKYTFQNFQNFQNNVVHRLRAVLKIRISNKFQDT